MAEEKNVASATKPEQADCLELVKKLADSYRCLVRRRELLRQQYEESKSWFYTKDEIIYKLSQGAHEESERVQTSGLSNPVERTVLNCDKVLASMNREVQTQRTEQFLEPYYEVCEQIELFEIGLRSLRGQTRLVAAVVCGWEEAVGNHGGGGEIADSENGSPGERKCPYWNGRHNWPLSEEVIRNMKQETAEDMLDFAKEVCQKYSRVKTLAEETQMQWRQDLEMAADSKYPGEKEMYDRQAEEGLARYTAVREWLKLADAAAFRIRDSKAQIVVRQHCLDRIPLKAVEFENGKHMGKTAVFYHKKIGLQQFSEELLSNSEQMRQLEKKFCKN